MADRRGINSTEAGDNVGSAPVASGSQNEVKNTDASESSGSNGVVMVHGDIFAAPANSVLVHACNCQGSWGAGIALAFKQLYPAAYRIYHNHCTTRSNPSALLGTTLLIPPQPTDPKSHWIACLFTSVYYGRRVDSPENILESTAASFEYLLNLMTNQETAGRTVGDIHACKINSGRFGVDWERSRGVLEEGLKDDGKGRVVFAYEFDEGEQSGGSSRGGRGGGRGTGRGRGRGGGGGLGGGQQTLRF